MKSIKVKTPAKINLTLEVLNKRPDGFHNIQSIMQAINLYDYITFKVERSQELSIELSGTSKEIPYDSTNLIHKAAVKFFDLAGVGPHSVQVFVEKNIPVAAGLAGGSSNAAGTIFALNELFSKPLTDSQVDELCASLGSDLNFCLYGGCAFCTSRGEIIEKLPTFDIDVSLVKPIGYGISAKEAYTKFAKLTDKSNPDNTLKLKELLLDKKFDRTLLYNSFEKDLIHDYTELVEIKTRVLNSLLSGSGPTFFVLNSKINAKMNSDKFLVIEGLNTISEGVSIIY